MALPDSYFDSWVMTQPSQNVNGPAEVEYMAYFSPYTFQQKAALCSSMDFNCEGDTLAASFEDDHLRLYSLDSLSLTADLAMPTCVGCGPSCFSWMQSRCFVCPRNEHDDHCLCGGY